MRVTVVHNENAGCGLMSREELLGELEYAGHAVTEIDQMDRLLDPGYRAGCDVVIAAGGDGTVLSVVSRLVGSDVKVVVLPLGTANNLAHALGMTRSIPRLVKMLADGHERRLDVGVAVGAWGVRHFVESAGVGWFCEAISEAVEDGDKTPERAQRVLADFVARYQTRHWDLSIDGHNESGDYLMIDVMNAGMLGPNLHLGHSANPADGKFDVVLATPDDQPRLLEYLEGLARGESPTPPEFYVRRASHVRLATGRRKMRIDGKLRHASPFVDIHVMPAGVTVLVPEDQIEKPAPKFAPVIEAEAAA